MCWGCVVQGMVTHVTDVKPLAAVLTYLDQDSNTEVYQEVRRCHIISNAFQIVFELTCRLMDHR
jgi:DNA replicative helicase MCM subunit Mcm2 (Cdc46/Mcm family)